MQVGVMLSSEDHAPRDLVATAVACEAAGVTELWISDHFHPWVDAQGHAPFVWGVLGAIAGATTSVRIGTGVTCPIMRIHPAIVAHAAATASSLLEGRFHLGVGSGENLNEHILGDHWPEAPVRLEMLEEAVEVMRLLWQGGMQSWRGDYYEVSNARIYDLPPEPIPVYVSAFGPKALDLAARIGDGYAGTAPDSELVQGFKSKAGADKPAVAGTKCCWGSDEGACRKLVHERWPNMGLPGQLSQELALPQLFEAASSLVTEEQVTASTPLGPDPQVYVETLKEYEEAGYDTVYLHNIGDDQEGFLRFLTGEVLPLL